MEMKPATAWALVAIVFIMTGGAITLTALDKDITVILTLVATLAIPVLGAFGVSVHQKLEQVHTEINGKSTEQNRTIRELQETVKELALRVPVTPLQIDAVPAPPPAIQIQVPADIITQPITPPSITPAHLP